MANPFRVRVFRGEQLLDERTFTDPLVKLGRHSSAHVRLDDRSASFVHAVLTVDGDEIALTDVSGRGTLVNGKSVGKKVLVPGDEVRIAGLRILVDRPAPAVEAAVPVPVEPPPVAVVVPLVAAPVPVPQPVEPPRPEPQPRAAFGTFVPQELPPPRPLLPHERPALQLSCFWGDQLLQVTQHAEPRKILMGPTPRCEVKAGSRELPLIEPAGDGFALVVEEGLRAHLRRGDEVRELEPGLHALEPTDLAWVETGHLRVEARFAAAAQRASMPLAETIDFRLVNLVLALSFVAAAFAISARFRDQDDVVADDLAQVPQRFVIYVAQPVKPPKLRTDAIPSLDTADAAPAPKHSGDEGRAGDPSVKHRKPAIGAIGNVRLDTHKLASAPGMLAGLGGTIRNMLGKGGVNSGEVVAALGNLDGPGYGSAGGMFGLGLRGGGPGGGGDAHTYGIGDIKTVGRRTGFGTQTGLLTGTKKSQAPEPEDTPPVVRGSIDPELIRQVIRRNASQIRFCYESRLASKPNLSGKVRVRFLVNGDGTASQAAVVEGSTLDDPELIRCLLSRFSSWIFPIPKGGGTALVTYPVWLRPAGG